MRCLALNLAPHGRKRNGNRPQDMVLYIGMAPPAIVSSSMGRAHEEQRKPSRRRYVIRDKYYWELSAIPSKAWPIEKEPPEIILIPMCQASLRSLLRLVAF